MRSLLAWSCVLVLAGLAACGSGDETFADARPIDGAPIDASLDPDADPDAPDAAVPDAMDDAAVPDAAAPDAMVDAAVPDGIVPDAMVDAATPDGMADAAVPDAAVPDAPLDAAVPDAAVPDAPLDAVVPDAAIPDAPLDAGLPMGGDDNVQWDHLYHAAAGVDPGAELVPQHAAAFRQPVGGPLSATTPVDVHALAAYGDVAAMQLRVWIGAELVIPMAPIADVTAEFRGQPEQRYLVWRGTIPAQPAGTTVYYRVRAIDGTHTAVLKAAAGAYTNPLGQHVRGFDDAPDDYAYTVP